MLYSFETPSNMLNYSLFYNNYEFIIDLFLELDRHYYNYMNIMQKIKMTIMDNSLYERTAKNIPFSEEKYFRRVDSFKPTFFILPDSYNHMDFEQLKAYLRETRNFSSQPVVVLHSTDFENAIENYKYLDSILPATAMIAFTAGDSWMTESSRADILSFLEEKDIVNRDRPHHLLGLYSPLELNYRLNYSWILSIDSSAPITATILEEDISIMKEKPSLKIVDYYLKERTLQEKLDIILLYYNIKFIERKIEQWEV